MINLNTLRRLSNYSKSERIVRLIEIDSKGKSASFSEFLEMQMIQFIRTENGEIEEVEKNRNPDF